MRKLIAGLCFITLISLIGFEARAQGEDAEANKLFVEAVTLYREAEALSADEKIEALAKVRALFDQITKTYPESRPAKVIAEGGAPGGVDLTSLPGSTPDGWNEAKRSVARDILDAYQGDLERLSTVASSLEWAILACAAYEDDGAKCTDDITGREDVLTSEFGWVPGDPIVANYLGVGQAVAYRYQNSDGRVALVFRGSDEAGDFATNVLGTADPSFLNSAQLAFAAKLAEETVANHPNTTFVGHSLGGRLAQIGALSTGRPAIAFNSAPLGSWETVRYAHNL